MSPERHVRTRLYFTSESHVHSLLSTLRYGALCDVSLLKPWYFRKNLNLSLTVSIETLTVFEIYHIFFKHLIFSYLWRNILQVHINWPAHFHQSNAVFQWLYVLESQIDMESPDIFLLSSVVTNNFSNFYSQVMIQGSLEFTFALACYFWSSTYCQDVPTEFQCS